MQCIAGKHSSQAFNPLNAELNPICHLLALLGGATVVVVSRLRVNFYPYNDFFLWWYSLDRLIIEVSTPHKIRHTHTHTHTHTVGLL